MSSCRPHTPSPTRHRRRRQLLRQHTPQLAAMLAAATRRPARAASLLLAPPICHIGTGASIRRRHERAVKAHMTRPCQVHENTASPGGPSVLLRVACDDVPRRLPQRPLSVARPVQPSRNSRDESDAVIRGRKERGAAWHGATEPIVLLCKHSISDFVE